MKEEEWYSNCCNAPPLEEVSDRLGLCMKCREGAVFYIGLEDDSYE